MSPVLFSPDPFDRRLRALAHAGLAAGEEWPLVGREGTSHEYANQNQTLDPGRRRRRHRTRHRRLHLGRLGDRRHGGQESAAASHDAVVAALAPICVERFRAQPDAVVKADVFIKSSSWERGNMVEKSGFATMPGSNTTDLDVAGACAEILLTAEVPKT